MELVGYILVIVAAWIPFYLFWAILKGMNRFYNKDVAPATQRSPKPQPNYVGGLFSAKAEPQNGKMDNKPVGIGNGNVPEKSCSTAEVYWFRTNCRKCGKEFNVSQEQKGFTGQLKFNHCGTSSHYTINYENPWGIPSKHPNHPPDSSGTLYLIDNH